MTQLNPYQSPEGVNSERPRKERATSLGTLGVITAYASIAIHLTGLYLAVSVGLYDGIPSPLRHLLYSLNGPIMTIGLCVFPLAALLVLLAGTRRDWVIGSFLLPIFAFIILRALDAADIFTLQPYFWPG